MYTVRIIGLFFTSVTEIYLRDADILQEKNPDNVTYVFFSTVCDELLEKKMGTVYDVLI